MVKKKKVVVPKSAKKSYSTDQLLEKAASCMNSFQFELAEKFLNRALEQEPNNTDAMDMLGELLVEVGQPDKAKELFQKSIALAPDVPSKYMSFGQLVGGAEAIASFRKGIELMLAERSKTPKKYHAEMNEQIAAAYCSLTEMYLTDACFEEDAELQCEKALAEALKCSPKSPEVFYLLASVRISQQRNEEALEELRRAHSFWQDIENMDPNQVPHYQLRFNIAKLFVELGQYQTAVEIVETLVDEQDFIAEVWHTLGLAYQGAGDLHGAVECLQTALKLFKEAGGNEADVIESLTTLIAKLEKDLPEVEEDMETDNNNNNDEEDGGDNDDDDDENIDG